MTTPLDWAMLPSKWILDGHLRSFPEGDVATSLSALKIYITILAYARATPNHLLQRGEAQLTYEKISEHTGVARALISPALERLSGIVQRVPGRGRSPNRYWITGYPSHGAPGWTRLPTGRILRNGVLPELSPRRKSDLVAVKLLLVIATFRDGNSGESLASYETITKHTGVPRNLIRRGISVLINQKLIDLNSGRDPASDGFNKYVLLGLPHEKSRMAPLDRGVAVRGNIGRFHGRTPGGRRCRAAPSTPRNSPNQL